MFQNASARSVSNPNCSAGHTVMDVNRFLKNNYKAKYAKLERTFSKKTAIPTEKIEISLRITERSNQQTESTQRISLLDDESSLDRECISPSQIFSGENIKRVLISSAAGSGKSTTGKFFAFEWGSERLNNEKFKYLFLIPLHKVIYAGTDKKLSHIIKEECFSLRDQRRIKIGDIQNILQCEEERVLLWLDGFDEIACSIAQSKTEHARVLFKEAISYENIVLTSRQNFLQYLSSLDIVKDFDLELTNMEFTDENIYRCADNYFSESGQQFLLQEFIDDFEGNSALWNIARIPLNLSIMMELWERDKEQCLHSRSQEQAIFKDAGLTKTKLYHQMVLYFILLYLEKNRKIFTDSQSDDFYFSEVKQEMKYLELLAYRSFSDDISILEPDFLKSILRQYEQRNGITKSNTSLFSRISAIGLIYPSNPDNSVRNEIDKPHEFRHYTFKEYLAARYLVSALRQDENGANYKEIVEFFEKNKYNPKYYSLFAFSAGILSQDGDKKLIKRFWELLNQSKLDWVNAAHLMLIVPCLEESRCDDNIPRIDSLLNHIKQWYEELLLKQHYDAYTQYWFLPLITESPYVFHKSECYKKTIEALNRESADVVFCATLVLSRLGHKAVHLDALGPLQKVLGRRDDSLQNAALAIRKIGDNEAIANAIEELVQGINRLGEHRDYISFSLDNILRTLIKFGKNSRTPRVLNTILNFISSYSGYINIDNVVLCLKILCNGCVEPIITYVKEATREEDQNKLSLSIFIAAGISSQLPHSSSLELALRSVAKETSFLGLLAWYALIKINALGEGELQSLTNRLVDSLHNDESITAILSKSAVTIALLEQILTKLLNAEKVQTLYSLLDEAHQEVTKEIAASVLSSLIVKGILKEKHFSDESICTSWKTALRSNNEVVQISAINVFKKYKTLLTQAEIEYLRGTIRDTVTRRNSTVVTNSCDLLFRLIARNEQQVLLNYLLEMLLSSQGDLYRVVDILHEFDVTLFTSDGIERLLEFILQKTPIPVVVNNIVDLLSKLNLNDNQILRIQHLLKTNNNSSFLRGVGACFDLKQTILAYLCDPEKCLETTITSRVFSEATAVIFYDSRLILRGVNEDVLSPLSEESLYTLREMFSRYIKRGNLLQMQLSSGYKITTWEIHEKREKFDVYYSFDKQAAKVKLSPDASKLNALEVALSLLNNILYLDLSENELDDLSMLLIIRHINHLNLTSLVMTRNLLTEKGFGYFLECLSRNPNLKFIYFDHNRISFEKYYSVTYLEPSIQNIRLLDLSMNYIYPGKMLEEHIGIGHLDRKIVYRESRLRDLMRNEDDRFHCKSLLTKPDIALLSQICSTKSLIDTDYNIDGDWSVGAVIANKTQYFYGEHAFLALEGVSDFGQRYIIMADLYSISAASDAIRIVITYCSPCEYLNRIKHGEGVYSRSFQISKEKEKLLMENIFDNRDQEKISNYQAISLVNHAGYVNCIRWIKDRLTAVDILLPTNWLGIPSLTVSHEQSSISCRIS